MCGKRYELERIKRYPTPPAWYLISGKALHAACDGFDLAGRGNCSSVQDMWEHYFHAEIDKAAEEWPDDTEWSAAGWGVKKQRYDHWLTAGADHLQRWIDFREENPNLELIALEEEVSYGSGEKEIKGYLDRVFLDRDTDELILIDIKSGSKRPESTQQLGIYRALWNVKHPPTQLHKGHYFMTKDGGLHPKDGDLSLWNMDVLDKLGEAWNRAKEAQVFLPVISNGCDTCSVRAGCYMASGDTKTTREYDSMNPNYEESKT